MTALSALENADRADVLITRLTFPPGNPNGVSLALMARAKRPSIIRFTWTVRWLIPFREQPRHGLHKLGDVNRTRQEFTHTICVLSHLFPAREQDLASLADLRRAEPDAGTCQQLPAGILLLPYL